MSKRISIFGSTGYDKLQKACNEITDEAEDTSIPAFDSYVNGILHTIAPCSVYM